MARNSAKDTKPGRQKEPASERQQSAASETQQAIAAAADAQQVARHRARSRQWVRTLLAAVAALFAWLAVTRFELIPKADAPQLTPRNAPAPPSTPSAAASASAAPPQPAPARLEDRHEDCVLALADLHGDLSQAQRALRMAGAIDAEGSWAGGTCTLVQTGDLVDRGAHSLDVLRLFEALKPQAEAAGGRIITLLGNHELESIQVHEHAHPAERLSVQERVALLIAGALGMSPC